jgi:hypothetical protein
MLNEVADAAEMCGNRPTSYGLEASEHLPSLGT